MSVKEEKSKDLIKNVERFLPLVHTKEGTHLFHPELIYQSLLRETNLSKDKAKVITEQVVRFLISAKLHLITAPLIREVVNVQLLNNGFEKERLQYTRIGLPYYDLKALFEEDTIKESLKEEILNWVITEYHAVKKLINYETISQSY